MDAADDELKPKYALAVSIKTDGSGRIFVELPDGTNINWPKELAPEDLASRAYLELVTPKLLEHRKKELARQVLLRILNIGNEE